ncbi:MAG TPA: TIGR03617 family F420-dependent LLM class oxidoreductase, partial [Anaerolineales bacterium]|nr:TIGR03617 family F420-dependent LLM class oxidoreductase [Anaerolineales bacterium]HNH06777.1 TIGR03617 family F420-dependent LLM class oxidoreductase [Anaerolineales bacterium]
RETMKLDAALPIVGLKDIPAIAEAAQAIGFDALWTQETQHDPFLPCTLIAEHSETLRFGTAIAVSFSRSPANLAYTAWDLAAQSNGRFILGLGTQVKAHIERRFGMAWPESVTGKLREQIQVIRAFWDCWQNGTKLNFRGEYYKATLMSPFFQPPPLPSPIFGENGRGLGGGIPIYIAGVNAGLAKLAGELCEGFHAHPFNSSRYMNEVMLPAIEEGLKKEGRKRQDITVSMTPFIATSPEEESFARMQIAFYASTPSYKSVMDFYGWGATAEKLSGFAAKGEWAEMPMLITDDMLNEFCLMTTQENLAVDLKKRYAGIADRLTLYTPFVPGEKDDWWRNLAKAFN